VALFRGGGTYDALMAYSGGKDSSYTLKLLREEFGLKVLSLTFDHGFMSPQALTNIGTVTEFLDIDRIMVSPSAKTLCHAFRESLSKDLYPLVALQRASSICNTCMNLVKLVLLKTALEMQIPFIVYGWSPGQAPVQSSVLKLNPASVRQSQTVMVKILQGIMGDALEPFILKDRHFEVFSEKQNGFQIHNVHPLAFLKYDEETIHRGIKALGWNPPGDTDTNSTNCLLNSFANMAHIARHGFHPYAFEMAGLVREGLLSREEALARLMEPPSQEVVRSVKAKLGVE
jgi:hypothetical protein